MSAVAHKSVTGLPSVRSRSLAVRPVCRSGHAVGKGKTDVAKIGVNSVEDKAVRQNLMGRSSFMSKKGWKDASGREGSGKGVYQFESKYGSNVDGYSPIYTPDIWATNGGTYELGPMGLAMWAGVEILLLLLGVGLIVNASQI